MALVLVDMVVRSWIAFATSTMPEGRKREGKQETGDQSRSTWGHNEKGLKRVGVAVNGIFKGNL